MMALRGAVLEHFGISDEGDKASSQGSQEDKAMIPGRIIIFSSYRESVTEILAMLQKHEPSVKVRRVAKMLLIFINFLVTHWHTDAQKAQHYTKLQCTICIGSIQCPLGYRVM